MRKIIFLSLLLSYYAPQSFAAEINYTLRMEKPNTHYFQVEMQISGLDESSLLVKMPVWAPGSYLVREFSKNVNMVYAKDETGKSRSVKKVSKNSWEVDSKGAKSITISYDVYAFELSVRTSFLDDSHGYLNGTSVFMYLDGHKEDKGKLTIVPHADFKTISTSLKSEGNNQFSFANYYKLVYCPVEICNQ